MEGEEQVEGFEFFLETEHLLSRFLGDSTVGIRRDKKESCSTHRGLCVGSVLRSFDKLREVGDLSYLGFTLYLSVL